MAHFSSPPQLDRQSSTPLYRQVEEYLLSQIECGTLVRGEMLPSVKELCEEFGLNHLTVRQAIRSLVERGLAKSVRGRGTFITLAKTRVGRVALVLPTMNDVLTASISDGVQKVLGEKGYRAIVMDSRHSGQEELDNIRQLEDLPLDGAIILPVKFGNLFEEIYRLKIDRFPFVLIDRYFYDSEVYSVVVDNYQGTFDLTTHMIQRGRTQLAWVGENGFSSGQDRFRGFCDALNEAGLSYRRAWIDGDADPAAATARLVRMKPRPDGIVYLNDFSALEGIRVIQEAGLSVPGDIAVGGFDDIAEAATSAPPLTTVRQPMERLGVEAAELLLEALDNPGLQPRRVVLPVELITRGSA